MIRTITWKSPPNLAIVKYWGKREGQIPMNPSVSFVLGNLASTTRIMYSTSISAGGLGLARFNGRTDERLTLRLQNYLDGVYQIFPGLSKIRLEVDTQNNFPHGAGIASSASGFSALAFGIASLADELQEEVLPGLNFLQKASWLARLGSGSAARSVFQGFCVWGETQLWAESSNLYAYPINADIPSIFNELRNTILVVSELPKAVSSTDGHRLMENHPYGHGRQKQAETNLQRLKLGLSNQDIYEFLLVAEEESLSLHALMLAASPGYWLFKPETLMLMSIIRQFREDSGVATGFSLDAGANVHLLWFEKDREAIQQFLHDKISPICPPERWLVSGIGYGAERID